MSNIKIQPGFATLNLNTQIVGRFPTHIALNAYATGNVRIGGQSNVRFVEIVIQQKTYWVEAECLTDSERPELPFELKLINKAAA